MKTGGHVLVADDHPLIREGLSLAARAALPGTTVVGAGTVAEAVAAVAERPPFRMILLDFHLPDAQAYSGLMALRFRCPAVPIVIVTAREDRALVDAARTLGAAGFLFKSLPIDEIAGCLRRIDAGASVFPADTLPSATVDAAQRRIADLSPAQHGVLMALADGRSNKRIASDLAVSEATVKAHLTAIFRKMGVANRTQALLAVQALLGPVPG